jgi:hypothetical protein
MSSLEIRIVCISLNIHVQREATLPQNIYKQQSVQY